MSEPRMGEVTPTPENLEDQYYADFQAAMDEEERIKGEIDLQLTMTQNIEQARQTIITKLAPQMEAAQAKSKDALAKWLKEIGKL